MPSLAVIAFNRMGYGPRPGDGEAFEKLGADENARFEAYVEQQLHPETIDDSEVEARLVAANDLRREQVKLGVGLSWERTIEELRSGLADTPTLAGLKKCRHLMITLGCDGAVWIDFTNKSPTATLVCDAAGAEDEFARQYEGKAFGFLSCMTSAVAHGLAGVSRAPREHNAARGAIGSAIRGGLDAMRSLITRNVPDNELRTAAIDNGMRPIGEDGLEKALDGRTTLDEVSRVVYLAEQGVKVCPGCADVISQDFEYCPGCGQFVGEHCEKCNRRLEASWQFCAGCGQGNNSKKAAPPKPTKGDSRLQAVPKGVRKAS